MPSRRTVLTGSLGISTTVLAGCLSNATETATGHLQFKVIAIRIDPGSQTYRDELLWIWYRPDSRRVDGQYDPSYVGDAYRSPDEMVVDDSLHEQLEGKFTSVRYRLGFCSPSLGNNDQQKGCEQGFVTRTDFNSVQLDDQVTVSIGGSEAHVTSGETGLSIIETTSDAYDIETVSVLQGDFDKRYASQTR